MIDEDAFMIPRPRRATMTAEDKESDEDETNGDMKNEKTNHKDKEIAANTVQDTQETDPKMIRRRTQIVKHKNYFEEKKRRIS
jgi:hypothetical protein